MSAKMTLSELHNKLFDILCIIDDISQQENVTYFIDSGTEIGAAREHDFVPWDDDMDIKVLAEDYPAFKKALQENLPPFMHIVEPDIFSPAFYDFTVRVYDERYLLRAETPSEKCYNNYNNYVGTDVFIFNQVNNSFLSKKSILLKTKILYGLGMAHRHSSDSKKYSFIPKIQIKFLTFIGKGISSKKICYLWKKMILKERKCKKPCRFTSNYSIPSLRFFNEEIYRGVTYLPIRGRNFPVPIGYDEELKQQYGDYMKPPKDRNKFIKHLY